MTTPLRVTCPTAGDIPPAHQLRVWVTEARHVVLQFPLAALTSSGHGKPSLVAHLAAALPECSVFDSGVHQGHECVTIIRVIPTEVVRANTAGFLTAMRLFRKTATSLAHRLADRLGVAPAQLLAAVLTDRRGFDLGGAWKSQPHGLECRFENRATGKVVEVRLTFGAEFGVLDPYFFTEFVKTTPLSQPLGRLLRHEYHDAARVIDILAAGGHLTRVESRFGRGWICRDDEVSTNPSSPCQAPPGWWGAT